MGLINIKSEFPTKISTASVDTGEKQRLPVNLSNSINILRVLATPNFEDFEFLLALYRTCEAERQVGNLHNNQGVDV